MDTLAWSEKLVENLELYCTYRVLPPNPRIDPARVITKVPHPGKCDHKRVNLDLSAIQTGLIDRAFPL